MAPSDHDLFVCEVPGRSLQLPRGALQPPPLSSSTRFGSLPIFNSTAAIPLNSYFYTYESSPPPTSRLSIEVPPQFPSTQLSLYRSSLAFPTYVVHEDSFVPTRFMFVLAVLSVANTARRDTTWEPARDERHCGALRSSMEIAVGFCRAMKFLFENGVSSSSSEVFSTFDVRQWDLSEAFGSDVAFKSSQQVLVVDYPYADSPMWGSASCLSPQCASGSRDFTLIRCAQPYLCLLRYP